MTLTADGKKRVVLLGAAPGDVFACQQSSEVILLRRVHRHLPIKKMTRARARKAVRSLKFKPAMSWEKLRALTRDS